MDEVTQVLDATYKQLLACRDQVAYAVRLIENPSERARWEKVVGLIRRWERDVLLLAAAWDASPQGKHIADGVTGRAPDPLAAPPDPEIVAAPIGPPAWWEDV